MAKQLQGTDSDEYSAKKRKTKKRVSTAKPLQDTDSDEDHEDIVPKSKTKNRVLTAKRLQVIKSSSGNKGYKRYSEASLEELRAKVLIKRRKLEDARENEKIEKERKEQIEKELARERQMFKVFDIRRQGDEGVSGEVAVEVELGDADKVEGTEIEKTEGVSGVLGEEAVGEKET